MKDLAPGVQLVVVRASDDPDNFAAARLWVAVVPREMAVEAVRVQVGEGPHVELSSDFASRELAANLNLRLGDVREIVESK